MKMHNNREIENDDSAAAMMNMANDYVDMRPNSNTRIQTAALMMAT